MKYKLNEFLSSDYLDDGQHGIKVIDVLAIAVIVTFGILLRLSFYNLLSADYNTFLKLWFEELKEGGGITAIGESIGNYTPPYMYLMALLTYIPLDPLFLIKSLSVVFDLMLAFAVFTFVFKQSKDFLKSTLSLAAILLAPTIVLNSGAWAQCDVIYTFFILLSLIYFIEEKPNLAMVFFAISFCFKLQAIFFLPVIAVFYLNEKLKLRHLLWIPGCYLISIIPAFIAGRPLSELLSVYIGQTGANKRMSLNCPTFYSVVSSHKGEELALAGILLCAAIIFIAIYLIYKSGAKLDRNLMITVSLFFALVVPFFLPRMHERYFYIAEVLSVLYAFTVKKRWFVPIIVIFPATCTYVWYLYRMEFFRVPVLSLVMFSAILIVGYDLYRQLKTAEKI